MKIRYFNYFQKHDKYHSLISDLTVSLLHQITIKTTKMKTAKVTLRAERNGQVKLYDVTVNYPELIAATEMHIGEVEFNGKKVPSRFVGDMIAIMDSGRHVYADATNEIINGVAYMRLSMYKFF